MMASLLSRLAAIGVVGATMIAGAGISRAEGQGPSPGAELLIVQYSSGGMSVISGPDVPSRNFEFALYSDGTILSNRSDGELQVLPILRAKSIRADIARKRHETYLAAFLAMKPLYRENCWLPGSDGKMRAASCISDAGYQTIAIRNPGTGEFEAVTVEAADYWRKFPDFLQFVPPQFIEAMTWMNQLRGQPAESWKSSSKLIQTRRSWGIWQRNMTGVDWPVYWPSIRNGDQVVCVSAENHDLRLQEALQEIGRFYFTAENQRFDIMLLDQSIPRINEIDFFRYRGITKPCP